MARKNTFEFLCMCIFKNDPTGHFFPLFSSPNLFICSPNGVNKVAMESLRSFLSGNDNISSRR